MNILGIGTIIDNVGKIADDLITTDEERRSFDLKERSMGLKEQAMSASLVKGQLDVNSNEAKHASLFVAGWRPFIGWIGGLALAYQFLLYPLLVWLWVLLQAYNIIPCHLDLSGVTTESAPDSGASQGTQQCSFKPPPVFDADVLFTIIMGMLGIGGMRSYDKVKKVDTKKIG